MKFSLISPSRLLQNLRQSSVCNELDRVYKNAVRISYDDTSKIILMSDLHRGDGGVNDNFTPNQDIWLIALERYFIEGYSYIEVGDADELWENKCLSDVQEAHAREFRLLDRFKDDDRYFSIFGNHDSQKQNVVGVHEGLILRHRHTKNEVLVTHGHQGDLMTDYLLNLTRWLVRYIWRRMELGGMNDPFSPAQSLKRRDRCDDSLLAWVDSCGISLIAGHTHRVRFPLGSHEPRYFNVGSCVEPGVVHGIEIEGGRIRLVQWTQKPIEDSGCSYVSKKVRAENVNS